jgi:hypothetical protein
MSGRYKMFRLAAIAIFSIFLLGASTVQHPACIESPEQYASFLRAIMSDDEFAAKFYMQSGCGLLKPDLKATLIEEGPYWIKIKVEPEGVDPIILYTHPEALKE